MNLDPIRLKVLALVRDRGTNLKNASIAIGRNDAYLHQFVMRGTPRVLAEEDRRKLAAHLGCNDSELRHDTVPPRKRRRKPPAAERSGDLAPVGSLSTGGVPAGFGRVAEIDVRASAGPGAIHEGLEEVKQVWFFPEGMIRHEFRARTADLRIITIDGDSMEPLLASGDRVLIDISQQIPVPPGIFVIWDGMGLVAKRIEHEPNSDPPMVVIRSVNPEYKTYERSAEEVHVVGRVVWTSRRL